jgi:hypothetical membrane protein
MARALLACGIVGPALFVLVLLVEGALRPGYDPSYHVGSALSLGDRGWIQITNSILCGALLIAFAVGVHRELHSRLAALSIAVVGIALVASGVFTMDPMRGYPPGTPSGTPTAFSWHHRVHDIAGPVIFLCIPAASIAVGRHLAGVWRRYSFVTAALALGSLVWFVTAWGADAPNAGLLQRVMIAINFAWIGSIAAHLRSRCGPAPRRR